MYSPTKLIIENIGPIKKISYDFSDKIALLIGENLTDEGQDSNGSGKSFVLESIAYATTGTSFRKVTDSELVREGQTQANIVFEMFNAQLNRTMRIERIIYSNNKSSKLEVFINNIQQNQITSVNDGNKFILSEFGLSREDILNYFFISKEKYTSFFSSSDTAKKDLISRFSKANLVDELFPFVESDKSLVTEKTISLEKKILSNKAKLEAINETIDPEVIAEQERKKFDKIKQIDQELKELVKTNKESHNFISELIKGVSQLEEKKDKIPNTDEFNKKIKEQNYTLAELEKEFMVLSESRSEVESMLAEIERKLSGVVECPKCNHNFNVSEPDVDLQQIKEQKIEIQQLKIDTLKAISENKFDTEEVRKMLSEYNNEVIKNKNLKNQIEIEIKKYNSNIDERKRSLNFNTKRINDLNLDKIKIQEMNFQLDQKIEDKITILKEEIQGYEEELNELKNQQQFYDQWLLNFKSFKTYLANNSLNDITMYTNLYLEKLNSSIRVRFDGYKELKSGKTKEQIDIIIYKFGEEKGSFGKLSGGEKARVELATILALSALINSSSESGGLNFVIVDEILESLDETGLRSVLKSMSNISQHVILVTHGKIEATEGFSKMKIVKRNGESYLENN